MEIPDLAADTKQVILLAASELFGTRGYDGTSIRDIVRASGVTLSAVNYHFGSKEQLYEEVIRRAVGDRMEIEAWLREVESHPATSAQEVSELVDRLVRRLFLSYVGIDRPAWCGKLLSRALLDAHAGAAAAFAEPDRTAKELLKRLLPGLTPQRSLGEIDFWVISVFAQIHYYLMAGEVVNRSLGQERYTAEFLDRAASYVARNAVVALGLPEPQRPREES